MFNYKIQDRIIYNPTFSNNSNHFLYGNIIEIDGYYVYIRFDINEKIFKLLITQISKINNIKQEKIIITI